MLIMNPHLSPFDSDDPEHPQRRIQKEIPGGSGSGIDLGEGMS
jgi:hypothetical protein